MTDQPAHILFVEDDEVDREGIRRALQEASFTYAFANDGAEALAILRDPAQFLPSLIVLDLKMPHVDGFDLLTSLHEDERFCLVPQFVFSSSTDNVEVSRAYAHGAAGYVAKQIGAESYRKLIRLLSTYLNTVLLAHAA